MKETVEVSEEKNERLHTLHWRVKKLISKGTIEKLVWGKGRKAELTGEKSARKKLAQEDIILARVSA